MNNQPDFSTKVLSIIVRDNDYNHDLVHPYFEEIGGRLFITGVIPKGSTTSDWNVGKLGSVAWDGVVDFCVFDSEAEYHQAIKTSATSKKKDKKKTK